jgi:hypothetical protein
MTTTTMFDKQNNPVDYVTALAEYKTSYAIIQAELASYDIDNTTTTNNGAN